MMYLGSLLPFFLGGVNARDCLIIVQWDRPPFALVCCLLALMNRSCSLAGFLVCCLGHLVCGSLSENEGDNVEICYPEEHHLIRRHEDVFVEPRLLIGVGAGTEGGHFGAAGGIGQPLSLLMKLNPLVSRLALYDIAGTPVSLLTSATLTPDLRSYVFPLSPLVKGYAADEQLGQALEGSDVVIIPAGVPRKPGMTRDDLFKINAGIVKSLCEAIAKYCPNALVNMISNPVNSTVPIAAEVFKSHGVYDEKRLFGVTTLDVVRAKTFYAGKANVNVADVNAPVIGGHAGVTILPLFSQASPQANLSDEEIKALTKRTQDGGTEVVEAKAGKGSATLSMAYAGAIFADACLKGLNGVPDVVRLGKNGVEEVLGLGPLSDYEQQGLEALKPELKSSIEKGIAFVHGN
ncbi:hypothetical protein DH2020_033609 [Rehmannia glutinosa]|uniref:malate dehydrogenase n=1 Tax=Rehmannia glutinosa TaxID=99300 RepID=A0ABR0VF49_REHGL